MKADDIAERGNLETALAEAQRRQTDLEQRLVALVAASGTLFGSPKIEDVLPGIIVLARTLIPADGYALWRINPSTKTWSIGESQGLSPEFIARIAESFGIDDVLTVPFAEPFVAESVQTVPFLEARAEAYRAEGIVSVLAVPLTIAARATGTLVFYHRSRHSFDDVEVQTARALSNLAAAAITSAELYDAQRRSRERAEQANRRAAILAEASAALAGSLDYEATLRTVANLAVPHFADWCTVDILSDSGELHQLAVAHTDPAKIETIRGHQRKYAEPGDSPGSVGSVIRSGKALMIADVTDAMLVARAVDAEHLAVLRGLGIRSVIVVPLTAHGQSFGALSFVTAESQRRYTDDEFQFAHDLAYRAAIAVENARAYAQVNAANRAKDEFLATLSHELRTPLNAVLGWARMLRAGTISPVKMPRAFEVIERNATAQLDLVEDLLDVSRIITGKFRLNVDAVELGTAIDAAIEALQPAATAKGIAIDVVTDDEPGVVIGDEGRLRQAAWNLLSNAIKFTPPGGRVTISRRNRNGSVEIEVADTGEGIDRAVLPYVFDRFRQADSGTTRTHMGLGLGLAIVRHIVELHGGQVSVSSPGKGQGATFRMALPMVPAEPRAIARAGRPVIASGARPATVSLAGVRAIVVDDDRDARELVAEVLRSRGADVTPVASARECFASVDRQAPDVVVADLALPDVDGFELVRRLRERPADRGGRVPAVALTAYARSQDVERSLAAGFQVHLAKPVDLDDLLSTVASLARGQKPDARR
jgi:signal transduction histidine kinase/ActR/RegA family two-component response regulator